MPNVPAVCDTCGAFFPSGIFIEHVNEASFAGNTVGPCPRCGGLGRIPDGLYRFTENVMEFLSGPERSVHDIRRLIAVIEQARRSGASQDRAREAMDREVPGLGALIPPRTSGDFWTMVAALATAATLLVGADKSAPPTATTVFNALNFGPTTTIIQQVSNDTGAPSISTGIDERPRVQSPAGPQKTGRNAPCPCGSGRKFKRCHGAPRAE